MPAGQKRRQEGGGRSVRYSERRAQRGTTVSHAPVWTDGAALAVQRQVQELTSHRPDLSAANQLGVILSATVEVELFMTSLRMGRNDTAAARAVLLWHAARLANVPCPRERFKCCQNISRVLRDRTCGMKPAKLLIGPVSSNGTFRRWLTADPARERHRPLPKKSRLWKSLRRWPVSHLRGPAVVCFERAIGRLEAGAGGVPSAEDVDRVVATRVLPTAVASSADHYVLLQPGSPPRFLSVGEVARSFGIPRVSRVFRMLMSDSYLSPIQAVSCLGAAVHVDVARVLVRHLRDRGLLSPGVRYGSACSGVDTFACALEAELRDFVYVFASEVNATTRGALLGAWHAFGLTHDHVYPDAAADPAIRPPPVGMWFLSPPCGAFSSRNHARSLKAQAEHSGEISRMLDYIRLAQRPPSVVVVENLPGLDAVGAISGLLMRIRGYVVEYRVLDPCESAGVPMSRARSFWVMTRQS